MIISHKNAIYQHMNAMQYVNRYNGAYYYSKEIIERIMPNVKTDYNWVTVNIGKCYDHSIVFIHNNKDTDRYQFLSEYRDLILVCGVPETCAKVAHLGRAIYLPLSIDVEEVRAHMRPKLFETAYAGRPSKKKGIHLPDGIDFLEGMPREELLDKMAQYKRIYAVGRTAIEAKALGCEVLPYDPRFPDPSIWRVVDNLEAAKMLQEEINR